MEKDNYRMVLVQSYSLDSLLPNLRFVFYPLVKSQVTKLFFEGKVVYESKHKVENIEVNTYHGKTSILSNVITQIGIVDANY